MVDSWLPCREEGQEMMYLVLVVKTSMDLSVVGMIQKIPFSSAGFYGMCPVFETSEAAEAYADGKMQIVAVSEVYE